MYKFKLTPSKSHLLLPVTDCYFNSNLQCTCTKFAYF